MCQCGRKQPEAADRKMPVPVGAGVSSRGVEAVRHSVAPRSQPETPRRFELELTRNILERR